MKLTQRENFRLPKEGVWPWFQSEYSFAGWIPTVSGHLSFSLIGDHELNPKVMCHNEVVEQPHKRAIVLHQNRPINDFPISGRIIKRFRPEAAADFLLVGQSDIADIPFFESKLDHLSDTQGALVGWIFISPKDTKPVIEKRRKEFLKKTIDKIKHSSWQNTDCSSEFISNVDRARSDGIALFGVRFTMFRTGEIRIWHDLNTFLGRNHDGGIPVSELERELAQKLPPHCYHFLKDVTHRHYHHNNNADQLIQLTEVVRDGEEFDDLSWRRDTLWGLARVALQYRHNDRIADQKRSLGVIAYAEAFQSTLSRIERQKSVNDSNVEQKQNKLVPYDFEQIKDSIKSVESVASWGMSNRTQWFWAMIGSSISCVALWAAAVQILIRYCASPFPNGEMCDSSINDRSLNVVGWIAEHPLIFLIFSILLLVSAWIAIIRKELEIQILYDLKTFVERTFKSIGVTVSMISTDRIGWLFLISILTLTIGFGGYIFFEVLTLMLEN